MIGILYTDSKIKYGMSLNKKPYYLFKPTQKEKSSYVYYVPYENKIKSIVQPKRYVLVEEEEDKKKSHHKNIKYGKLINVIGLVGDIEAEYEHLLYYHNLFQSTWKIGKENMNHILDSNHEVDYNVNSNHEVDYNVFSIDPIGCMDRDDAFHIEIKDDYYEIGVHIASPTVYFEKDGIDWRKAIQRVSTIYMPHRKINMIPNQYSDNICSFIENEKRYAISIIYKLNNTYPYEHIGEPMIKETVVCNQKAYSYEEYDELFLFNKNDFYSISSTISSLSLKKEISDSHQLVEYWMIVTNQTIAKYMSKNYKNQCILRVHHPNTPTNMNIDNQLLQYLNQKETKSASYEYIHSNHENIKDQTHSICNDVYTHFTSPIRRSIDFWNHLVLRNVIDPNEKIDLDSIQTFMKRMKKMERDSKRIQIISKFMEMYSTSNIYEAYILDIKETKLKIYIPEFGIEDKITIIHSTIQKELNNNDINEIFYPTSYLLYQKIKVKIYIFKDADVLFQKIRWSIYNE